VQAVPEPEVEISSTAHLPLQDTSKLVLAKIAVVEAAFYCREIFRSLKKMYEQHLLGKVQQESSV
jgi:hypothetical protein